MYSFSFTTSAVEGGEWSASRHGRDLPPERTSGTRCTGCWVGLRAGLDTVDISVSYCDFGFVFFFQIVLIAGLTRPNSRQTSAFFFPFSIYRITLTFFSTLKTFILFVIVVISLAFCYYKGRKGGWKLYATR
jgi:hypothetical protein